MKKLSKTSGAGSLKAPRPHGDSGCLQMHVHEESG